MNKITIFILILLSLIVISLIFVLQNVSNPNTGQNQNAEESQTSIITNQDEKEIIYSVDELLNSGLPEGKSVKVRGILGSCFLNKVTADYEGPGGGCYLLGQNGKPILRIGDLSSFSKNIDQEMIVEGKVGYCGGKKISRTICELKNVEIQEIVQE